MRGEVVVNFSHGELLQVAIDSVKQYGSFALFYKYLHDARRRGRLSISPIEAREFEAKYSNYVYRRACGAILDGGHGYESVSFASGEIKGDYLDGFRSKVISLQCLISEIPDYKAVIQPRPYKVYVLEHTYRVVGIVNLQPLFKVVCTFRRGIAAQLYIVGRDMHTREPFALGVPNGFVSIPIEACLRWTMDAHKGDVVVEI